MISATQAKNGTFMKVFINGKFLEIYQSISVNVRNDMSTIRITCLDIDQFNKESIITKAELIDIFDGVKPFDIRYINEDPEVVINIPTTITDCKCEGYSILSICGDIQKIVFNATFDKNNMKYNQQ